ncbi:WXG100 family type VII secretion target [Microbacterium testaceum]|uniref:WXG100 family type VII secretion target n=1 Tax=Microbacterium TaxID=33882 RepID=UPI00277F0ECE|nr:MULTISPECIES: WXG100 family type VII secretion target [Microbacterium]MDQ1111890.1 WXG100 family type VII secretion target [Microbacterium testaceum]MDR6097573.1 WXG100 family type VII secretion target [Microbacterium sp. SORGH_AS_0454]
MTISFDSDRHESLLVSLRAATNAIGAELDALERQATTLRSSWSGEARDAYDEAQDAWSACRRVFYGVLSGTDIVAASAGDSLRRAEQAVRSLWA